MPKEPTRPNGNRKAGNQVAGVLAWRNNLQPALEVRWNDVDQGLLRSAVDAVTLAGSAIILGRTRDGGAYSLVVLTDNDKIKEYPPNTEALEQLLSAIANYFTD